MNAKRGPFISIWGHGISFASIDEHSLGSKHLFIFANWVDVSKHPTGTHFCQEDSHHMQKVFSISDEYS